MIDVLAQENNHLYLLVTHVHLLLVSRSQAASAAPPGQLLHAPCQQAPAAGGTVTAPVLLQLPMLKVSLESY